MIKFPLTRYFLIVVYSDKLIFNTSFYKQFNVIISSIKKKNAVQSFANQSRSNSDKLERSGNFGSQFRAGSCLSMQLQPGYQHTAARRLQSSSGSGLDACSKPVIKMHHQPLTGFSIAGYLDLRHN